MAELVSKLATALKFTTIYPPSHPRVAASIAGFLENLPRTPARHALLLRDGRFHFGAARVVADDARVQWLAERLREARLRGLEIDVHCSSDEVLQFAVLLRQRCKPDADTTAYEPLTTTHLRALPLLFAGGHDGAGGGHEVPMHVIGADTSKAPLPESVAKTLATMRESPAYRERIAAMSASAPEDSPYELDLLTTIGQMLPAEVANDPERITAVVEHALDIVQKEMHELVSGNRELRGSRLLLRAVEVARSFFLSTPPVRPATANKPTGRPEDARFQADVRALLAEQASLPGEDRDLVALLLRTAAQAEQEALAICLHLYAQGQPSPAVVARIRALLPAQAPKATLVLDAYLRGGQAQRLAAEKRLQLLSLIVESGHAQLARERDWVDHELISRHFPESLGIAAHVLGDTESGRASLRALLATLKHTLQAGAATSSTCARMLTDPVVLRALLTTGGDEAHLLVFTAIDTDPRTARNTVIDFLRSRPVPEPVQILLQIHANASALTAAFVRDLYAGYAQNRYDVRVRTATGELLRDAIESGTLSPALTVAAIRHLYLVPGQATDRLLRRLARFGLLRPWDQEARAIRRAVAVVSAELATRPSSP